MALHHEGQTRRALELSERCASSEAGPWARELGAQIFGQWPPAIDTPRPADGPALFAELSRADWRDVHYRRASLGLVDP
jgi:hypothetical protein